MDDEKCTVGGEGYSEYCEEYCEERGTVGGEGYGGEYGEICGCEGEEAEFSENAA